MVRKERQLRPRSTDPVSPLSASELDFDVVDPPEEAAPEEPAAESATADKPDVLSELEGAVDDLERLLGEGATKQDDPVRRKAETGAGAKPEKKFVRPEVVSRVPRGPAKLILPADLNTAGGADANNKKGKRKSKKGQKRLDLTPVERRQQRAGFMVEFIDQRRKANGASRVILGGATKNLTVGIPCPSLAFEFLIAANCMPLSVVVHLLARHGTGKSGMVAEFMRWFIEAGGWGDLKEVETKFSPSWFESIIGPDYDSLVAVEQCDSMDDWQKNLQESIGLAKKMLLGTKEKPGLGQAHPFLFAVDSVMGKLTDESNTKIDREGSAGRNMPAEALSLTRYVKMLAGLIDRWPFTVVLVNHLKDKINAEKGEPTRSWSGGSTIAFQETLELELQKYGPPINTSEVDGFHVAMTCYKNSIGVTGRRIHTRVVWWEEEQPDGGFKQRTVFDWEWATVKLLHSIISGANKSCLRLRKLLADHGVHLACPSVSAVENTAWSRSLGMREKDALPWSEVGRLIHADADLMRRLRLALRIREFPLLRGDYLEQVADLADQLE